MSVYQNVNLATLESNMLVDAGLLVVDFEGTTPKYYATDDTISFNLDRGIRFSSANGFKGGFIGGVRVDKVIGKLTGKCVALTKDELADYGFDKLPTPVTPTTVTQSGRTITVDEYEVKTKITRADHKDVALVVEKNGGKLMWYILRNAINSANFKHDSKDADDAKIDFEWTSCFDPTDPTKYPVEVYEEV